MPRCARVWLPYRATGAGHGQSAILAGLAEAHRRAGQRAEGLNVLVEALAVVHETEERFCEAELYLLKGKLLLNAERGTLNDKLKTSSVHR